MPFPGAMLSTSLLSLFRKLVSAVISALGKLYGPEDELERLKRASKRLQARLDDAEQRKVDGEFSALWLRELQNISLDAEDVMDEFQYEDLRLKVSGDQPLPPLSCTHTASFLKEMSRRIDGIWRRLDEITEDKRKLDMSGVWHVGKGVPETGRGTRETGSLLEDPDVIGRAKEKGELTKLLLETAGDAPTGLTVLSIVGMGGLGKTSLAQWVYNTREVEEHFHLRVWVWVSQDFDLKRVTSNILEHVVGHQTGLQGVDNLTVLQQKLVKRLREKRFLLVLDDVWEEDRAKWCEFSTPLTRGHKGSKVLITTRHENVANMVQSVKIELKALPFNDCWLIFKRHAFPDEDAEQHPHLDSLGEEIVKKVKGIPLAARTIGSLLRFESKEDNWMAVLKSELWESEEGDSGISPALRVSYEYLPPHLKRCFAYCSVFPKGYSFGMLELVQLWMAQGYVRPQAGKPVGVVGRHYFNELFNRSLIQLADDKYIVHDLLHDLGQSILQHDYYEIRGDEVQRIPEDAYLNHHLLLHYDKSTVGELEVLYQFRRLHTLLLKLSLSTSSLPFHIPPNLLETMICLRVLNLSDSGIETLPDSIGCLRHLRFLALRGTLITYLPDSLCSLYMLQTLLLGRCDQLNILPEGMSNLISLHYLEAKPELASKIVGIGKLAHLQNLQIFSASEGNVNKIGELKEMNELQGKLCIQNLQRVESSEEASEATLVNKLYLETLELEWAGERDVDQVLEESIIEALQPPPNLNELTVKCYAGSNLPSWISDSSISSLEFICLHRCTDLNHIPKALTNLILREVRLNALPSTLCRLPLQKLVISKIAELRKLPLLPATLKELTIDSVGLEALPDFDEEHGLSMGISLSILKIHGCPHLKTLQKGLLKHHLKHLRVLSIKDCQELVSWPQKGFLATLASIKEELCIEDCPKLESLPEGYKLPTSLEKLTVTDCVWISTDALFSQLHILDCGNVDIQKCYYNLAYCSYEMLQHIKTVNWLQIKCIHSSAITSSRSPVLASYGRERTRSWALQEDSLTPRVTVIVIAPFVDDDVAAVDDNSTELLSLCLGGHAWTSSLRILTLYNIPDTAFLGIQYTRRHDSNSEEEQAEGGDDAAQFHHPIRFPSLEKLWIFNCRKMRILPTETMLCHMPSLKELTITDCPELTLSSLQEAIQSVPSLEILYVYKCPQLLMPPLSPSGDGGNESTLSTLPPLPLPPPLPLLRYLYIDDVRLLARLLADNIHHGQDSSNTNVRPFRDHLLTSLRFLRIDGCECTSLAGEAVESLRTLGASLQSLGLFHCPSLNSLPADLSGLLPNLKALWIENCPAIRCLPERGLPASLQLLRINQCPTLAVRCSPWPHALGGATEDDWPKMAHVPLIAIDGEFLRGSYNRFLGLHAEWDFLF